MRALVIDDSRTVRAILRKTLTELGLDVVEAGDGREGLDQLRRAPDVDLVLVDWNMPEMNGLDFIRAVRADRAYDAARIMMATTETEQGQVARALEAGANEYLMKPFTKEVLVAKLSLLDVIAQDEATSVVWGMPGAVARAGLADRVLPLAMIAPEVVRRARSGRGVGR